ncbi:MAG: type I-E CRISPR-associated protein Cas7/Cse4/CasC [Eubacteriales bacterium]|nr:type I-E CRISPR-associated protein Cas7/Cse4/CasC [Eubacteriales bacterium]
MNKDRLYVDIHVLQTVPPSCVNRDDTCSPKTAVYGGVTRARVSSQSWKKAMRDMFPDLFPAEELGYRTKKIVSLLAEELSKAGVEGDPVSSATAILTAAGLKIKNADVGTDALFFISRAQAKAMAALAVHNPGLLATNPTSQAIKELKFALQQNPGIDIALFGRMVADDPSLNTDACAQVAHAISTHRVSNEYDYFTAVDDLAPEDNAGAAHIGTVEFNSSTLYRYGTLAVHALKAQLAEDTAAAVLGFVRAFITSMPTGKQNTFANRTLPDAVMVALRQDQPINLVGAFERPIIAGDEGYVTRSLKALSAHAQRLYGEYAGAPAKAFIIGEGLKDLGEELPFGSMLEAMNGALHDMGAV